MNYHIIPQEKVFDAYIEDIYELGQEHNNIFWVRGDKNDSSLLKTKHPVVYVEEKAEVFVDKLKTLNPEDKLFISWYDLFIGECILNSGISNEIYVYVMGGDFYNDPLGYHDYWLYDKYTKKIVYKLRFPQIKIRKKPKNWHKTLKEYIVQKEYKKHINDAYREKLETIKRIDNLVTVAQNEGECELIKHLYPTFRGRYVYGSYDQNFEIAKEIVISDVYDGNRPLKVLLGNSADPTNNHIDACIFLQKAIASQKQIICPISYGDPYYSNVFQQWAKCHIQDIFNPISHFMNRKDYVDFLGSVDIVVMYHNRQQALGNIITSLVLGKPVFLKSNNPVYLMLKKVGIPNIYDVSRIGHLNLVDVCKNANECREQCITIIQNFFSKQARLNDLRNLIS